MAIKILHRYMALRFLRPFLFGMGLFAILIFLGDLFDKMPRLVRSQASLWIILQYLWLEVPYWAVRIIPMATLLATLFAVTGFVASGEWIAAQSAGFEARDCFRPILAMAAVVTLACFAAQETVLPACFARAQRLWRDRIHPEWEWDRYEDVMLVAGPGRFITVKTFRVKAGHLERPVLDFYEEGRVSRQIDAREARWDQASGRWRFHAGVMRVFGPEGSIQEEPFADLLSELTTQPQRLVPRSKDADEMSIMETRSHLQELLRLGVSPREALAALHSKIAYPFSNFVLCLLGIPLALRLKRLHRALGFAVVLAMSFAYLWVMEMGRALAAAGRLPPLPAAWMANLVFGSVAAWLYSGIREAQ